MNDSFQKLADNQIQKLFDMIEENTNHNHEADITEDVLYIITESGQYVINKHAPSKQVWLSSPKSGAGYFSYDSLEKSWLNSNNEDLSEIILSELGIEGN